jgi:hypothetical protein
MTMLKVLMPTGMLGGGFPASTITRGIELGADAIVVDGGSTDSGPHYLGTGTAKTSRAAVARDLRILLVAARRADIPLVVGSCGTAGTDSCVDWVAHIADEILAAEGLRALVARIYSEQSADHLRPRLASGRIRPLPPALELEPVDLERCSHIVAVMGHEPISRALADGAQVVLAGRATDTALVASVALPLGFPAGEVWHAGKISECGGFCTNRPTSGGVLVTFDEAGFVVEPLAPETACTPFTVAAHMLYENADPFRLREPDGLLDTTDATYRALDDRRVRVAGSKFDVLAPTIKLEGAAPAGYQTMIVVGLRSPKVLSEIDTWCNGVLEYLREMIRTRLDLRESEYDLRLLRYGHDAILGEAEPLHHLPTHEIGLVFLATASEQAVATEIAKLANPLLLHAPLPTETAMPSYAFPCSPAEIERGQIHEFVLCHAVEVEDASELFRTEMNLRPP